MAALNVVLNGVIVDLYGRVISGPVKIMGELAYSDRQVGGGPMPPGGGSPGEPPHIWGGGNEPFPTPPIANVPGAPGYKPPGVWGGPIDPYPGHPLPEPPPITQPPEGIEIPPPGSPPVIVPGQHPVAPIVPPPAIVVSYPGIGPVLIPQPLPPT